VADEKKAKTLLLIAVTLLTEAQLTPLTQPPRFPQIKLDLDLPADELRVVRSVDGAKPQPPQKRIDGNFFRWVVKQKSQAKEVFNGYEEATPVDVVAEGGFAVVPAAHEMVECAGVLNSQGAEQDKDLIPPDPDCRLLESPLRRLGLGISTSIKFRRLRHPLDYQGGAASAL